MTAQSRTDRHMLSRLAVRFRDLRADPPHVAPQACSMVPLSVRQMEIIEECLLSKLTTMTREGWSWFREEDAS